MHKKSMRTMTHLAQSIAGSYGDGIEARVMHIPVSRTPYVRVGFDHASDLAQRAEHVRRLDEARGYVLASLALRGFRHASPTRLEGTWNGQAQSFEVSPVDRAFYWPFFDITPWAWR